MLTRLRRWDRGNRRRGGWRAPAAVLVGLALPFPAASVDDRAGALSATLAETAVTESSGLAASRRSPEVVWTHNDSGDGPLLYATDRAGRALGVWAVTGADNVDWEDLAIGPGADGADALYVADTGDNRRNRTDPTIYRVAEPPMPDEWISSADPIATAPAERFPLVFPDGPRDVEALLVHPATGEVVLVSKESGEAGIYLAPSPGEPEWALALERIGGLTLPGIGPATAITGGAVSADGRRLALRTPFVGYEWKIGDGASLTTALAGHPRVISLPSTPRGEAIAYGAAGELLLTSEGSPCPLSAVATDG